METRFHILRYQSVEIRCKGKICAIASGCDHEQIVLLRGGLTGAFGDCEDLGEVLGER